VKASAGDAPLEKLTMQPDNLHEEQRAALSSLMDGEGVAADGACRAWRAQAQARADWHAYHLIGDVLRSDEHRCDAAHDARFVARLREKLAAEPAVLAPQPAVRPAVAQPVRPAAARRWMAPAAVAAGFVAVAGVLVMTRVAGPDGTPSDRNTLAGTPGANPQAVALAAPAASAAAPIELGNATLVRNAELDRYLSAHREVATNASALVAPGGVMRSAAVAAPGR
jgi:sigma-E factor negative regulatory protein RseA